MRPKPSKNGAIRTIAALGDLLPDARNANDGTPRGRAMVESSVRRFGFGRSVLADRQGHVIAGNKTLEAASAVGGKVKVVQTTGDELVVVQRTDLDLGDVAAQELAVADNRASEVGLAWNAAQLVALADGGAELSQFFRPPEWEHLVGEANATALAEPLPDMEIQPFEHHDYVMVVCRDSHAWTRLCDLLKLRREGVTVGGRRKVGVGRVILADRLFEVLDSAKKKAR